ncbi:MAG: hypothetical protein WBO10_14140 [Pyrinomonadaceae bacterium]
MKAKIILTFFAITLLSAAGFGQSVVVTRKKVTYTRPKPIVDFKKTFTINYPKVKARTTAISRKIEAELSYEKLFGVSVNEEINGAQWLEEADYSVLYNKNGLLCLELYVEGVGAYPDGSTKHVVVDTVTGKRVLPGEVFIYIGGLIDILSKMQRKEITDAVSEIKGNKDWEEPNPEPLFENAVFEKDNLKGFSINANGVTFYYDYGFPHMIQAMEPNGEYSLTWAQMKPYIRVNSALGRMTR